MKADHLRTSSQGVLVLTTGGTIDKQYFDDLSEFQVGQTVVTGLLEVARVTRAYKVEEVMRKDSLELSDEDRLVLASHIERSMETQVVVTHGTDTMTKTASALSGMAGKTIVLVGALAPARFSESDAAFNLGMAFSAAQLAPPGVYIAMNGTIFAGDRVSKDREKGVFVRSSEDVCS